MPKEIIKRASEILLSYENTETKKIKSTEQLTFNIPVKDELKEKLNEVDPVKITPIEALNILSELKEISKK